ncbi:MAG: hypothetical protein ACLSVG_09790 [Clostridia bacterium]
MKKIFCISVILLLICVTGCHKEQEHIKRYEVTIGDASDSEGLDIEKSGIQWEPCRNFRQFTNPNAAREKQLVLNGQPKSLIYTYSNNMDLCDYSKDVYATSEGEEYGYKEGTDLLISVSKKDLFDPFIKNPGNLVTEQDYRDWIETILTSIYHADLTDLKYSCYTSITKSTENWTSNLSYNYFIMEDNSQGEVSGYEFYYTRWMCGYPTTDYIQVLIDQEGNIFAINLNPNDFITITAPEIDQMILEQTIDQAVKRLINTDRYSLDSYRIRDTKLFIKEGTPRLAVTVSLTIEDKNKHKTFNSLSELYVNPSVLVE